MPELTQQPQQPGNLLGKYRLERKLGEGGMGSVWLAEDTEIGGKAAIKILRSELVESTENRTRFAAEAKAVRAIHHPHIVQVYDLKIDRHKDCYLAMEYLVGESLSTRISRLGRIPPPSACFIVSQVASA